MIRAHHDKKPRTPVSVGRGGFVSARAASAGLALVAVALLTIAEFTTVFEVTVGSLDVVRRSTTAGDNHGYALLAVAVVAVIMTLLALRGARPPAVALGVLGVVALTIALAVDVPDTRGSGDLPESLAYEDAQARAGAALGLEIAGGALLVVAGGVLLALGGAPARRD